MENRPLRGHGRLETHNTHQIVPQKQQTRLRLVTEDVQNTKEYKLAEFEYAVDDIACLEADIIEHLRCPDPPIIRHNISKGKTTRGL